jgi:hypothetical protein
MQITIGIDISKETLDAYRFPDNHHIQVANGRAGHKSLVRWIGKQNGSLVLKAELGPDEKDERVYDLNPVRSRQFQFVYGPESGIADVAVKKLRLAV